MHYINVLARLHCVKKKKCQKCKTFGANNTIKDYLMGSKIVAEEFMMVLEKTSNPTD